jgi:glycosyltransferase involved in cell wall biosynthesis
MNSEIKPTVSICCITYNHEKYIAQAIESFLMQKTNFPYEIIIGEDCSRDQTRAVCIEYHKRYSDKIKLFLNNSNKGMHRNFLDSLDACQGKYIAVCEGDDYWIDPYKLQKQVAYLEANPEYGLVFTDADHYHEVDGSHIRAYDKTFRRRIPTGDVLSVLLQGVNPYKTCTALFRKSLIDKYGEISSMSRFKMSDFILWLYIASLAKIGCLPDSTAVYRIRNISASHHEEVNGFLAFCRSGYKATAFFAAYYNHPLDRKKMKQNYRKAILTYCINSKQYKELFKHAGCFPFALVAIFKEITRRLIVLGEKRR